MSTTSRGLLVTDKAASVRLFSGHADVMDALMGARTAIGAGGIQIPGGKTPQFSAKPNPAKGVLSHDEYPLWLASLVLESEQGRVWVENLVKDAALADFVLVVFPKGLEKVSTYLQDKLGRDKTLPAEFQDGTAAEALTLWNAALGFARRQAGGGTAKAAA